MLNWRSKSLVRKVFHALKFARSIFNLVWIIDKADRFRLPSENELIYVTSCSCFRVRWRAVEFGQLDNGGYLKIMFSEKLKNVYNRFSLR